MVSEGDDVSRVLKDKNERKGRKKAKGLRSEGTARGGARNEQGFCVFMNMKNVVC